MSLAFMILKGVCVLVAAILVGNWFLAEVQKSHARKGPWYGPYLSIPGVLIIILLAVPIILWAIEKA